MELLSNLYSALSYVIIFYLALYWPKAMFAIRLDKEFSKLQGMDPQVSVMDKIKYFTPPFANSAICDFLDLQITKVLTWALTSLTALVVLNAVIARHFMQDNILYLVITLYVNLAVLASLYLLEIWTAFLSLKSLNLGAFYWQVIIPPLAFRTSDKYAISYFKENGDAIIGRFN